MPAALGTVPHHSCKLELKAQSLPAQLGICTMQEGDSLLYTVIRFGVVDSSHQVKFYSMELLRAHDLLAGQDQGSQQCCS